MSDIRTITVLTPCYNEAENVHALYERVRAVFRPLDDYRYEHVFIDNASTDETVSILREIAAARQEASRSSSTRATSATSDRRTMRCCSAAATPSSAWRPTCRIRRS